MVFCDFCGARATLCGDRRGRGAKTHGFLRFLKFPRDPLRGSAWSRCKNPLVFAISKVPARPSAGIGVVEVQKPIVFCDFCGARATLCGDRRGRGAKTHGFLRFLKFPRGPLRGSAWSRCKNPWFLFCDFCGARATLCGDRRGRGAKTHPLLVEVQKPMVFCDFCGARATLCGNRRGRGAIFCDFCCSNWSSGVVSWFARLLLEPAGRGFDSSLVRVRASQDATCILQQLAQSNLRRASCTEQLAQTNLHRPVCAERLA